MPETEVRLAKLSRPRVGNVLARERLFASLDRLRERPVVWIAAQPGAGKTTLLASYADARRIPCIWYQVDSGDADPASFFYHLGLAAQSMKRGKREVTPLPLLTAEHRADLAGFSRRYFRELYARMGRGSALVLDNLHEIEEGMGLHRVLACAFEEVPDGIGVLVASRGEPPAAYAPLIARERFAFVDAGEIRLTLEETGDIAMEKADLDAGLVKRLHEQSDGWAAGLTLLVERARRGDPIDGRHDSGTLQHVFAYFAEQLLAQDFRADTETLLQLGFLPRILPKMAEELTGDAHAGALLEKLHRRHLFTERRSTRSGTSYELHALLRAYLQHSAAQAWPPERRREVAARAAALLEAHGASQEAVALFRDLGDWEGLARVILGSAQALIAQGRRQTLLEWIAMVPEELMAVQPRLRYWKGSALAPDAPREARAELERAHAGFVREDDRPGRILAASGIIYTHYLEMAELRGLDPWIDEILAGLDAGAAFPTPAVELHVQSALLFALEFRRPDPACLDPCAARVLDLVGDARIGANEKVASAAILLFHDFHGAHLDAGLRLVTLVQPLLEAPEVTAGARALWWMQVGYFAGNRGDYAASTKGFETASRICAENGLSIPLLEVYVHFGQALTAVAARDFARAEAAWLRAEVHWKTFRRIDVASGAMVKGLLASHRGDLDAARQYSAQHLEVATEAGIQWQMFNATMHCAFVANAQGRRDDARELTRRGRELISPFTHRRFLYMADLLDAYGCLLAGDREGLRRNLARGLAEGRVDPVKFFLRIQPHMLPRLLAAALVEGIEVDSVRRTIQDLHIEPPAPDVENWPWPLAVRTLGRFEVQRDGRPLEFSRKAPRKTLALLKAIIAAGGTNVPEQALLDSLWGDEEGDAASKSLGAAVLRLRALLGDNEAVIQQAGTLSLDRARVWVDAWAFEDSSRLDLYRGSFLPEEEGAPWAVAMRERLRSRFIQRLGEHGAKLERAGRFEEAVESYLAGLDADSIVEPFYQGLMRCYHRLDRFAEAASTYRRLKQILSVTLGVPPSATTERLYKSLRLPAPSKAESVGNK